MAKRKTTDWDNFFYIVNLNGYGFEKRIGYDPDTEWYNLNIQPSDEYSDIDHHCEACGSRYENILNIISKIVSSYKTPDEFVEVIRNMSSGGRLPHKSLERMNNWFYEYGEDTIDEYYCDIIDAIDKGLKTRIIGNCMSNIKVTYNEEDDFFELKGSWSEWFEKFVNDLLSFDGKTKKELYLQIFKPSEIDVYSFNEFLSDLKNSGCSSIKELKQLNVYRLFDVLVPIFNEWSDSVEE